MHDDVSTDVGQMKEYGIVCMSSATVQDHPSLVNNWNQMNQDLPELVFVEACPSSYPAMSAAECNKLQLNHWYIVQIMSVDVCYECYIRNHKSEYQTARTDFCTPEYNESNVPARGVV